MCNYIPIYPVKIRLLYISLFLILSLVSYGQGRNVSISGAVVDDMNREPVELATVRLLTLPDSTLVRGAVTGRNGSFSFSVKQGRDYVLCFSYLGFKPKYIDLSKSVLPALKAMGEIVLESDVIMLDEAVVTAEAPPVQSVGDTLVYNAAAYKVTDGAVLEELVGKMPGVEIADDGTIRINGQELKKITVNGKEFFGGDVKTGLKNLPVDMIEKIKTYNKESDMERLTGIDDGEDEVTLDIIVKKNHNNGWFGNADVAGGSEERFATRVMLNHFTSDFQGSFIGSSNNANDMGFGGGANARWRQNKGFTNSHHAGLNFALDKGKVEWGGSVKFSYLDEHANFRNSAERFNSGKSVFSNSNGYNRNIPMDIKGDMRIEWHPNKNTSVVLKPVWTYGTTETDNRGEAGSFVEDPLAYVPNPNDYLKDTLTADPLAGIRTNVNDNLNHAERKRWSGGLSVMANRRISDKGRSIGMRLSASGGGNDNDQYRNNKTHYFRMKNSMGEDSILYRNQYITAPTSKYGYSAQLTYSEPIAKGVFLQLSYQFSYKYNDNQRSTYNFMEYDGWEPGMSLPQGYQSAEIDSLSKSGEYHYYNHNISLTTRVMRKKFTLSAGVSLQPQHTRLEYHLADQAVNTQKDIFNYAPKVDFKYRFSKKKQLRLMYHGVSQQPNVDLMLPITDNSSPLNVRVGNPGLKPAFNHTMRLSFNSYNVDHQRSIVFNLNGRLKQNSISQSSMYNEETGGRTTTPMNINGNWDVGANFSIHTALKNKQFYIGSNTTVNHVNDVSYFYDRKEKTGMKNTITDTYIREKLTGTYRNDWMEATVNGSISYRLERNRMHPHNNQEPLTFYYGGNLNFIFPWGMKMVTNIVNQSRRGYTDTSMNRDELIWNALLSQSLFKGNATLSVEAYDILQRKSNLSRNFTSYQRSVSQYDGINSYVIVHFIYRLNIFGGKMVKAGAMNKQLRKRGIKRL